MHPKRLRDVAGSGLSVLAAIVVAALGVASLLRALETFQPLGFAAERTAAGWTVSEVLRPESGLEPGDQILLAGGREPAALAEVLRASARTELAVLRSGELLELSYRRPPLAIDWPYLVLALIGALYLLIGVYTALRERRAEARLFYLWCLASAAVYLFTPSGLGDAFGRWLYGLEEVARALLPPLTLHLFLVFPRPLRALAGAGSTAGERAAAPGGVRWVAFLYLPAAALLTLHGWLMLGAGRGVSSATVASALPLLDRASLVHLVAFSLTALVVLGLRLARHREWEEHRQLQLIAVGLAAGYVPFLLLYVVPFTLGAGMPALLAAAAVAPLAVVPLTFSWAILRYKLWDLGVVLRETASTVLTVFLGVGVFALAHLAISRGVPADFGLARNLLSFGSGVVIAGLLLPARRQVGSALERLQYGRAVAKRRALARLGRELLLERDLDRLSRELLDELMEAIELDGANLYLVEEGRRLVPAVPDPRIPADISLEELHPDLWDREVEALTGVSLPAGRLGPRQLLFIGGYRYAFPLAVRGGPVGLLVTTFRIGEVPLSSDDLELIRQLVTGAALAIENARLLDELQRQLEQVVHLQRFSEGIIESSPAGIAVLDPEGRILSANEAFGRVVGRDRASLVGTVVAETLPVEPLPAAESGLVEVSYCDPEGRERNFQLSVAGFHSSAAGPAGEGELRILVVHDVAERVAMERAMREQDRLAALGVLAAGVAHEVNTPITGISSYAQMLLAETPVDDPRYPILRKVERQTFRAARIVNNLLDFARKRSEERTPLDLVPVVEESLDLLAERRASRGVALELRLPGQPLEVLGNDGELQQVFTNLALNAIDAMAGGGTLTVEARALDGLACVWVQDTGPGIPPEEIERIFEPFYSTKASQGGTGLGLSISHDIVRSHGGQLHVASEPGRGTRFRIELPLHDEE
ncbi:MAG TPA: ATP-binding protein [Thermoanaerobaculia bacterium]|nr:ATP-binding protein [Thermoanaerobaculia bacterium]